LVVAFPLPGLFRYSRHPNYFGDSMVWWGIYIIACSQPGGFLTFIGPITMTWALYCVTGVPPMERRMVDRPGFEQYKQETSIFIPWFPREAKKAE
jgi:steroid 5-alpha reductase family enzyme